MPSRVAFVPARSSHARTSRTLPPAARFRPVSLPDRDGAAERFGGRAFTARDVLPDGRAAPFFAARFLTLVVFAIASPERARMLPALAPPSNGETTSELGAPRQLARDGYRSRTA